MIKCVASGLQNPSLGLEGFIENSNNIFLEWVFGRLNGCLQGSNLLTSCDLGRWPFRATNHAHVHASLGHTDTSFVDRRSLVCFEGSIALSEPGKHTKRIPRLSDFWHYTAETLRNPILRGVPLSLEGKANATHRLLANSFPLPYLKEVVNGRALSSGYDYISW